MTVRRLHSKAIEKVWGSTETEPWYARGAAKTGEVWFVAPEEPRLLIKFLFTSEKLSVQVHPGDSAAGPGKTEMWHVLRAAPGAQVALGFERLLTGDEARAAAISGEIEGLLRWYGAQAGDTFFVPAGTVHAIGAGLALCEIQQHSDVTFRLYDYGRPRELHLDAALKVANLDGHPGVSPPTRLDDGHLLLVDCPYFRTEAIRMSSASSFGGTAQAQLWICLEGEGLFGGEPFGAGEVWVAPAGVEPFRIQPGESARWLKVTAP